MTRPEKPADGLRRGARYDSIFYGAFSGAGSTFDIRVRFDMKKPIDLQKFQTAANRAVQCYPEFSVRPVIKDGRVFYEENLKPVKLAPDDGKRLYFGTDGEDGTNGYLFVFLYGEKHVTLSLFHGITDARGMIAYVITVLWNYVVSVYPWVRIAGSKRFTKHGVRISPAPYYDMDETERRDPLTAFAGPGDPIDLIDGDKLFRMPPEQFDRDDPSCRLLNLEISNKAFLQKTKELGTSFGPLLAAIVAEAVARAYDIGDKTVSVVLTADPRKQFDTFSFGNMAYNVPRPETAAEGPLRQAARGHEKTAHPRERRRKLPLYSRPVRPDRRDGRHRCGEQGAHRPRRRGNADHQRHDLSHVPGQDRAEPDLPRAA